MKKIWFDMDGTIVNLYAIEKWREKLDNCDTTPYRDAKPLVNMARLAKAIHKAQNNGYMVGVITWTAKNGTKEYNERVAKVKKEWLKKHLPTVEFNKIIVVDYGTPKNEMAKGILFDDEEPNRKAWGNQAYEPIEIFEIFKRLN